MYIRTLFTYFDEKLFVYRKEKSKIYYYQHHSFFLSATNQLYRI